MNRKIVKINLNNILKSEAIIKLNSKFSGVFFLIYKYNSIKT